MTHRIARVFAVAAAGLLAACGDATRPDAASTTERDLRANSASTCSISFETLVAQANTAFGAGSPDASSVIGKLGSLQKLVEANNMVGAKAKAYDIVGFTFAKNEDKPLPGGNAAVGTFATSVFCYAGLNIPVTDPANSEFIEPSDLEQVVYNADRDIGIKFAQFPVTVPTLIVITKTLTPAIITKLDKYPVYFNIQAFSELTDPFVGDGVIATVGACATAPRFLFTQNRLRLGHGTAGNTVTTLEDPRNPAAEGIALICTQPPAPSALRASAVSAELRSTASAVDLSPEDLESFAGGVGGTVKEFSPFAPVDGELEMFAGGVGGTVKEFIRATPLMASTVLDPAQATLLVQNCATNTFEGAIGSLVGCRPSLTVSTFQGTEMFNVPVAWTVNAGGGSITPNTAGAALPSNCGSVFASTASTLSSIGTGSVAGGVASVCWKLGTTPGANSLTALASTGGDAITGVVFDNGGTATYTATANPPSQIAFTTQPAASQTAGVPFGVTIEVQDENGERVFGFNGPVTLTLNTNTFAPVPPALTGVNSVTVTAVEGVASFNLTINTAATGYALTPSLAFGAGVVTGAASTAFNVISSAAATIQIVSGNGINGAGQTAPAGSNVPVNPTVRVRDAYGNLVTGASVTWTALQSSAGIATPAASTTGTNGETFTVWTVGDGANELKATLTGSNPEQAVFFTATGTTTLSILNSCAIGGQRDPINGTTGYAAFWMPGPANGKTLRSIQLYFGVTGSASAATTYQVEMTTQSGTFNPLVSIPRKDTVPVTLRGNASENAPVTFTLPQPIVGAARGPDIMVTLRLVSAPTSASILYNAGGKGCFATQVSNVMPFPQGTTFRSRAVAMVLKGN